MDKQPPSYDPSGFVTEPYAQRVAKPWGYELHWVRAAAPYMGKLIHIAAGKRLSLQVHDAKQESYLLISGRAKLIWEDNSGQLVETELQPNVGYSTQLGQSIA